jgi:hypothetical protein
LAKGTNAAGAVFAAFLLKTACKRHFD